MGSKNSKTILTYKQALTRCTNEELQRLKDGFAVYAKLPPKIDVYTKQPIPPRRSKDPPPTVEQLLHSKDYHKKFMDKTTFVNEVFGPAFPERIAERFFSCFDSTGEGRIGWKDFVCGMVLFLRGTEEEKALFLYSVYDIQSKGTLSRENMTTMLQDDLIGENMDLNTLLDDLFKDSGPDGVTVDQVKKWALQNKDRTALTTWIFEKDRKLNPKNMPDSQKIVTPKEPTKQLLADSQNSLAKITQLDKKSIEDLYETYKQLSKEGTTQGTVDKRTLSQALSGLPPLLIERMFTLFPQSQANDNQIDIRQVVCGISSLWGGDEDKKLEFCFNVYDTDCDDRLTKAQTLEMLRGIWRIKDIQAALASKTIDEKEIIKKKDEVDKQEELDKGKEKDPQETLDNPIKTETTKDEVEDKSDALERLVNEAFQFNIENEGSISLDEYKKWIKTSPVAIEFTEAVKKMSNIYMGVKPSNRSEERSIIKAVMEEAESQSMKPGDVYYILWIKWWDLWKDFVFFDDITKDDDSEVENNIDPIDNQPILEEKSQYRIKPSLVLNVDYVQIPANVWNALFNWYSGGPILRRYAVNIGNTVQVEVYLLELTIILRQQGNFQNMVSKSLFSSTTVLINIRRWASKTYKIANEDSLRLWYTFKNSKLRLLDDLTLTIGLAGITDTGKIYVEQRGNDGFWPMDREIGLKSQRAKTAPGLVGLANLGNTCYLNSSIQSLSNIPELARYFITGTHKKELNKRNPLGCNGDIAIEFGKVIKKLWDEKDSKPSFYRTIEFKNTISQYADQFSGFAQHDAQELLGFLLDALHEDLNRVINKPITPGVETANKSDKIVAKEFWEQHQLRNQSIIVDLFHGLLKSTLTCDKCGHVSLRFEPFTFLNLPLPVNKMKNLYVTLYRKDGSVPVQYGITVDHGVSVGELKAKLSMLSGLPPDKMVVVDLAENYIFNVLSDQKGIGGTTSSNVYVYEVGGQSRNMIIETEKLLQQKEVENEEIRLRKNKERELREIEREKAEVEKKEREACKKRKKELTKSRTKELLKNDSQNVLINATGDPNMKSNLGRIKPESTFIEEERIKPPLPTFNLPPTSGDDSKTFTNGDPPRKIPGKKFMESPEDMLNEMKGNGGVGKNGKKPKLEKYRRETNSQAWLHLPVLHRILEQRQIFFLVPEKPQVVGRPFLVSCLPTITFEELNKLVWESIKRFVNFPNLPPSVEGHPWEKVKSQLPYRLKYVSKSGTACSSCVWSKGCVGCPIVMTNQVITLKDRQTIAIEWDSTSFNLYFSEKKAKEVLNDQSVYDLHNKEKEPINLASCLQEYISPEHLDGENLWYCSQCQEHQPSVKIIELWKLPPVIIIHLKRFEQLKERLVKIDRLVQFSHRGFDFTPFLPQDQVENAQYDLYACLNHFGNLGAGHYTTYALNQNDSKWYCYDDGRCSLIDDIASIESSAAYLLFYVRKNFTQIDWSVIKQNPANESNCTLM